MRPRGNVVGLRLAKEADTSLASDIGLGFNSTFCSYVTVNEQADIIQLELEPTAIGRYFPFTPGVRADARYRPTALLQP